jgi:hypothetical protein
MRDLSSWRWVLVAALATAFVSSFWWAPPFMVWLDAHGDQAQSLDSLIQIVLALMTFTVAFARRGPANDAAQIRRALAEERRGLAILRRRCAQEVEERLAGSLYAQVLIALGRRIEPGAVAVPWARELERPGEGPRPLPPETPTAEVFDRVGGALLILGEPGAGKSVELLTLARALLARAKSEAGSDAGLDLGHPVPVVLNLSTWALSRLPLDAWLAEELWRRHEIPRKIGADWVARDRVLPLLDGLDEVRAECRADCAAAIDTFRAAHGLTPIAVCCRSQEYRALPALKLRGALAILPLDRGQIERYLRDAGPALAGLRQALAADRELAGLAETPLMLNVMSLTYEGMPCAAILAESRPGTGASPASDPGSAPGPDGAAGRRDALFAAYLERVFTRKPPDGARWSQAQTRRYLVWLAGQMRRHGLSVFRIEDLQPDWGRRWVLGVVWVAVVALFFVIVGFYGGGLVGLAQWPLAGQSPDWIGGLIRSAEVGALLGLVISLVWGSQRIEPMERVYWSWTKFRRDAPRLVPGSALVGAPLLGCIAWFFLGPDQAAWGLPLGSFLGTVIASVVAGLGSRVSDSRSRPNQGFRTSLRNGLRLGILGVPPLLLVVWISGMLLPADTPLQTPRGLQSVPPLAVAGFAVGLIILGGFAALQHYSLRLSLRLEGRLPLRLADFLDHAARLVILRRSGGTWDFIHRLLLEHLAAQAGTDRDQTPPRRDEGP